jgi:hypothetical protein
MNNEFNLDRLDVPELSEERTGAILDGAYKRAAHRRAVRKSARLVGLCAAFFVVALTGYFSYVSSFTCKVAQVEELLEKDIQNKSTLFMNGRDHGPRRERNGYARSL